MVALADIDGVGESQDYACVDGVLPLVPVGRMVERLRIMIPGGRGVFAGFS